MEGREQKNDLRVWGEDEGERKGARVREREMDREGGEGREESQKSEGKTGSEKRGRFSMNSENDSLRNKCLKSKLPV